MSPTETAPAPATETAIPKDPLVHKSYAVPTAIAMAAVVVATLLAVTDEMWLRRPYKGVQAKYQETYSDYLAKVAAKRRDFYDNVFLKLPEFVKLNEAVKSASESVHDKAMAIEAQLKTATDRSRRLGEALKISKSELSAATYEAEHEAHEYGFAKVEDAPQSKKALEEIAKIQAREIEYTWTEFSADGGKFVEKQMSEKGKVADLLEKGLALEAEKATRQQELGAANASVTAASKEREKWLAENSANLKYVLANADDATKKAITASGAAKYLDESVVSLRPDVILGLKSDVDKIPHSWNVFRDGIAQALPHVSDMPLFGGDIKQIHIRDAANWVDRCETCHLNARSPMPVTVESLRATLGSKVGDLPAWETSKIDAMPLALFASHPNPELLKTHDPERFGCSMCHNGNGVAITSVELAHGENEHWLQPLFPKENIEAGCVQCHQKDLVLAHGERINAGRDDFRRAGCWGCHKYENFNTEIDRITALEGRTKDIENEQQAKTLRAKNLQALSETMDEDPQYARNKAEQVALAQDVAGLETEKQQIARQLRDAFKERQRVGPNLKEVRVKILRGFLTEWIKSPRDAHKDAAGEAFRPDTKMPTFRWTDDEEVKDVAAFLWQSALDPAEFREYKLPAFRLGDAKKGEELFKTTGCLVCHSIGKGADRIGNDYAANLSNLGEKDTPEFVQRWIHHPRERLAAYDRAREAGKRDVTGHLATDADADNYVWTNHTIMPNFRLNDDEVRDIATYLTTQKRDGVKYEDAPWLDDRTKDANGLTRFDRGRKLVLYQGCAGCHEIRGLEDEKGIGTELTQEGGKPIERLDFGHHTIAAERGIEPLKDHKEGLLEDAGTLFDKDGEWYRPRGFFLHKIAKPDFFDESKYLPDRFSKLRMPQFKFAARQILDLTTFILGSVDSKIPTSSRYQPDDAGQAIREGWWIVKKYNCQGCHQIEATDEPALWKVPFFAKQIADNKRDQFLPPTLVGVGFRLQPEFIARFLRDPSLGGDRKNPRSVRAHLPERMPTFDFSDDEIAKLVRFFEAMAKQPAVYQPPKLETLTSAERAAAKAIYFANGSCAQCHVVDGVAWSDQTKGPNLSYAPQRLRYEWTHRWVPAPGLMQPNTQMTQNFGEKPGADGKWRFAPELPETRGVSEDHAELMVRYILSGLAGK